MNDVELELVKALAWPLVAVLALAYIWASNALGKLVRIPSSIDDLKKHVSDLQIAEDNLRNTMESFQGITEKIVQIENDANQIRASVDSINKRTFESGGVILSKSDLDKMYGEMDAAWKGVTEILGGRYPEIDKRMVAAEVHRISADDDYIDRISPDLAEEIGFLHSTMKSYRRRQSTLEDWLTEAMWKAFVRDCDKAANRLLDT